MNPARATVLALADAIVGSGLPLVEPTTEHAFHGGMYARTIYMPEGMVLTGREHFHEHFNILSQGRVGVQINGENHILTAPAVIKAEANSSKAFVALEDSVWTTVHICSADNVEDAEEELLAPVPEHIAEANKAALKTIKFTVLPAIEQKEI